MESGPVYAWLLCRGCMINGDTIFFKSALIMHFAMGGIMEILVEWRMIRIFSVSEKSWFYFQSRGAVDIRVHN